MESLDFQPKASGRRSLELNPIRQMQKKDPVDSKEEMAKDSSESCFVFPGSRSEAMKKRAEPSKKLKFMSTIKEGKEPILRPSRCPLKDAGSENEAVKGELPSCRKPISLTPNPYFIPCRGPGTADPEEPLRNPGNA